MSKKNELIIMRALRQIHAKQEDTFIIDVGWYKDLNDAIEGAETK